MHPLVNPVFNHSAHATPLTYPETSTSTIEAAFTDFTERPDIAILLINQHVSFSSRQTCDCWLSATRSLARIVRRGFPFPSLRNPTFWTWSQTDLSL